jgi:hypothetical protein
MRESCLKEEERSEAFQAEGTEFVEAQRQEPS